MPYERGEVLVNAPSQDAVFRCGNGNGAVVFVQVAGDFSLCVEGSPLRGAWVQTCGPWSVHLRRVGADAGRVLFWHVFYRNRFRGRPFQLPYVDALRLLLCRCRLL